MISSGCWTSRSAKVIALLAVSASIVSFAPAEAQEFPRMQLRSAQFLPAVGFSAEAHQWWADEIERRTDGQVTIEIFWGGSLVGARDIPSAVASGAVDIGNVPSTYDPARTRLWMTLDMPFNVRDYWCGTDAARIVAIENEHLAAELERNNMVPVVGYNAGSPGFVGLGSFNGLSDFQGLRMRTYGGARVAMNEALGISPVFMNFAEIYEAIERGVLDGAADVTPYLLNAFNLYEIVDYFVTTPAGGAVAAPLAVFNRDVWEGMPENLQDLILEVGREHDMRLVQHLEETERAVLQKFEEEGLEVHNLDDDNLAAMEEAGRHAQDLWLTEADQEGVPAREVWEHFQELQRDCEADIERNGYPWER